MKLPEGLLFVARQSWGARGVGWKPAIEGSESGIARDSRRL